MMSRTPFRGQEEEILTRKPQVLNSLAEDYSGIPSELGWQRLLIHLCLFYHPWQVRRVCEAFFSHFFHSRALILFFGKSGREVRRGRGQRSFFPSEMRSWGLLPASRALKVKRKNGRSQRPKKNDILLVTTPPARAFVVGASAFNWKQVQAPPVFLQCPTHSHTCMHTRVHMLGCTLHSHVHAHSDSPSSLHPLKPGDSLLNLMPHAKPRSLRDLCPHLSGRTPGGQAGASYCRWQVETQGHVAGRIAECSAKEEEPKHHPCSGYKSVSTQQHPVLTFYLFLDVFHNLRCEPIWTARKCFFQRFVIGANLVY